MKNSFPRMLIAALSLGAIARLLTLPLVIGGGTINFTGGPDAYYHFRRAELAMAGTLADFDSWANFPAGAAALHLPRAYSHLLGFVLARGGMPALIFLPFLFGVLSILAMSRLSIRHAHPALTLNLYALMPASVILTSLGAVDHHCLEALFLILGLSGRRWYLPALAGAYITTTTWPVIAMTILITELFRRGNGFLDMMATTIGPLGLLIAGYSYLSDPWLEEVKEMQPLFSGPEGILRSFSLISLAAICIPIALPSWWIKRRDPFHASLLAATLVALPLALLHSRFVVFLAVPGALSAGDTLDFLRARFHRGIAQAFIAALFIWSLSGLSAIPFGRIDPDPEVRRALDYLRRNTPSPGDYLKPEIHPRYGVVASWDLGHAILSLGTRPAMASPFHTGQAGRDLMKQIFFSPPSEAGKIADQHAARYLFLTKLRLSGGQSRTLYEQLYILADTGIGWRRIYPSPDGSDQVSPVQIWERYTETQNTGTVY